MEAVRRKCFISYHHADQEEVSQFVRIFDHDKDAFISRGLGQEISEDIIKSTNPDYVMSRIRQLYLRDSSVTIIMLANALGHADMWIGKYNLHCAKVKTQPLTVFLRLNYVATRAAGSIFRNGLTKT